MQRLAMVILWPSFLAAALAEGCFFSLVDPNDWALPETVAMLGANGIYTLGFFFFWTLCALASMLTYYLANVPEDHNPPF